MIISSPVYILLQSISNNDIIEDVIVVGAFESRELAEEEQERRENKDQIEGIEGAKYSIQITRYLRKEKGGQK